MKDIVLIDNEPYSTRRRDLFMVEEFIGFGYKYEVWCLANYLYIGKYKVTDELTVDYLKNVDTLNELELLISRIDVKNTIFIVECNFTWKNRRIHKLLSDYNCFTIKIDLYANSIIKRNKVFYLKKIFFQRNSIVKISQLVLLNIYKKIFKVKDYNRMLSSSNLVARTDMINHPDYEKIHFNNYNPIINSDYIVFCDSYFPFHPDLLKIVKLNDLPDGIAYQQTLSKFFDYLENKYNMPVIIAAHPKAMYIGHEFGNRRIIRNETVNLVKYSKMVVLHSSNSVSYSLLMNKPIVFVTTNDYEKIIHLSAALQLLATNLGHKVYNLNSVKFEQVSILHVDEKLRLQYIYSYLTSLETQERKNIDIVRELIDSLIF